jgi:TPR repeat protein
MIHLSYMYRNGLGVKTDEAMARDLLEQAAQLRNATALYMLREQGLEYNEGVLFEHLENEFFSAPKKINMKEIVPAVASAFRNK